MTEHHERAEPAQERERKVFTRKLLLLCALTLLFFLGLAALSFVEIRRKAPSRSASLTPGEISAEALARYREESERLGEIREERRAKLTAEDILERVRKAKDDGELPRSAELLADFRFVSKRSPEAPESIVRGSLELLRTALEEEEPSKRKIELLSDLILQAALAQEREVTLPEPERQALPDLLEAALAREAKAPVAALLVLLRRTGCREEGEIGRLRFFTEGVGDPQLRAWILRTLTALEQGGGSRAG